MPIPHLIKYLIRRNTVLKKWFISYLLILIIPLVGTIAIYFSTYEVITQEIIASNSVTLNTLHAAIDNQLDRAAQLSVSIMIDERFKEILKLSNTHQDIIERQADLIQFINNYRTADSAIDILIYVPALDYCFTTTTANKLQILRKAIAMDRKNMISIEEWREIMILENPYEPYIFSNSLSYRCYGESAIVYRISTTPLFSYGYHEAIMFISLQFDEMKDIIKMREGSLFVIFDKNGVPVLNSGGDNIEIVMNDAFTGNGYATAHIGSGEYICAYKTSEIGAFTYAVLMPSNVFWNKNYYVSTITVIGLVAASIIGLLLSIYLLRKNYMPIATTMKAIRQESDDVRPDEFDIIREHLAALYTRQDSMQTNITNQRTYLRESYLRACLHGDKQYLANDDILESLHMDFTEKTLRPVSMFIRDLKQNLLSNETPGGELINVELLQGIERILAEELGPDFKYQRTHADQAVIYVYMLPDALLTQFDEKIEQSLVSLCDTLQNKFGLMLYAVIGVGTRDIEQLSAIYTGMLSAHTYQYVSFEQRVLRAEHLIDPTNTQKKKFTEYCELLCEAVRKQAIQDARNIVGLLFTELSRAEEPFTLSRYTVFSIINELLVSVPENDPRISRILDEITDCECMSTLKRTCSLLVETLCDKHDQMVPEADKSIYLRIERYVAEHYTDPNLSLTSIAQSIGLGAKYISRLFKIGTGQGLLDYINNVRIHKAKEILQREQPTINELAERVGYSNPKTFRRAFQKVEGMNPGQYRSL